MTRHDGLDEQPNEMGEPQPFDELDDSTFERLFASLDDVHASDELKASTLAAIFEQLDEDEQGAHAESGAAEEKTAEQPALSLVSNNPQVSDTKAGRRTRSPRHARTAARPRRQSVTLRAAAVLLVVVLGIGGGAAYALPASHVIVSMEDTTFDLGVNVFGLTISATANTEDGTQVLDEADLHNRGFEDAFDRLLAKYEDKRGAEPQDVTVKVDERFGGQGAKITRDAERIVERRTEAAEGKAQVTEGTQSQAPAVPNGGDNSNAGKSGNAGNVGNAGNGNATSTTPSAPATPEPTAPVQSNAPSPAATDSGESEQTHPSEQPAAPAQSSAASPSATDTRESEPAQTEERPTQQMSGRDAGGSAANESAAHEQGEGSGQGRNP